MLVPITPMKMMPNVSQTTHALAMRYAPKRTYHKCRTPLYQLTDIDFSTPD